jgi:hypothetical protein
MAEFSPETWTLRFKAHKTTVILHVNPLHTFSTIKSHLYNALEETTLKHPETGESIPLPPSPSDIQLGRPVNINDAHEGFQLGEWEYTGDDEEEEEGGKGKGKAKADGKGLKDCPKGAGLKDGAVLAFRWAGDGSWDGEEEDEIKEGDMWGVQLATFEDAYGVANEGDVGGGKEYDG